ncbi:MAG: ABC transporter ATP-binding protein [Bacteroidetes bacterium]|nr:ABC transporter ATP-binding protein [Bacteroidota bacterium]
MLSCQNIHKNYGNLHVLKGISLQVKDAEIVCITGESGAGKSTLLHILGTLDMADSGNLHFREQNLLKLNNRKLSSFRNKNMGFVFQFHQLLPEFTALENVCIPSWIAGKSKREAAKDGLELLSYLGLADRSGHKPNQLSGGEQQRVAVARALINKPGIVFADEPSGNLDSTNAEALHRYFLKLRDDFGQSFIIVTHNRELAAMGDRNIVLKDGMVQQ